MAGWSLGKISEGKLEEVGASEKFQRVKTGQVGASEKLQRVKLVRLAPRKNFRRLKLVRLGFWKFFKGQIAQNLRRLMNVFYINLKKEPLWRVKVFMHCTQFDLQSTIYFRLVNRPLSMPGPLWKASANCLT